MSLRRAASRLGSLAQSCSSHAGADLAAASRGCPGPASSSGRLLQPWWQHHAASLQPFGARAVHQEAQAKRSSTAAELGLYVVSAVLAAARVADIATSHLRPEPRGAQQSFLHTDACRVASFPNQGAAAVAMIGVSYAAVPLYKLFCAVSVVPRPKTAQDGPVGWGAPPEEGVVMARPVL